MVTQWQFAAEVRPRTVAAKGSGQPLGMLSILTLLIAQGPNAGDCPNGECGYDAGYSTAETIALVAFGLAALAVLVALVVLFRFWRAGARERR